MTWFLLMLAICAEVAGTTCMKLAKGFTQPVYSVLIFVFYAVSFILLTIILKKMDLSVAYAVWAGLGTALVASIGIVWFREPVTAVKVVSIVLIILGVVGLNLASSGK